jgi:nifR3 family TIM-barrel protein
MVSAKGLVYGDKKTASMCRTDVSDDNTCEKSAKHTPYVLQFFTSEPDVISEAITMLPKICEQNGCPMPDMIDINMGCPVPKVVGNGCGSALMKDTRLAADIVSAAVKAAERLPQATIPITAKIRSGFDNINAVEFSKALEAAGAALITVHPRTRQQFYGGKADTKIIQKVKSAVNIPIVGSGDIKTPEDAKFMYNETGCDLVMVGRGSYGKPWLFSQIAQFLDEGVYNPEPPMAERAEIMIRQIQYAVGDKGEYAAVHEGRQKCAFFIKGLPHAASLRKMCSELKTLEDVFALAQNFYND